MITLLLIVGSGLLLFRVAIDLFPFLEKDIFKDSEDLISFDDVEGLTLNLWDKLIDQATVEAERNTDLKCWVATFKEMREGDIQLFSFLRNRLSKREMRHLIGTLNYSGVYTLAGEVYREKETHMDVEGLKATTAAITTCIGNFGAAKRAILARARSFCETKLAVLENFASRPQRSRYAGTPVSPFKQPAASGRADSAEVLTDSDRKKVLLIGLASDSVDFNKWPQLSVEKLEAAFKEVVAQLDAEGYAAVWCLTDRGETAEAQVTRALDEEAPNIVLIGAGVRTDPDHFLLFEKIINLVHTKAPNAKIAFNSLPYDSLEAVQRWS